MQRRASHRHQFSEEAQLNSMSTRPLDIKENFLTIRAASPLHQGGVCMISFHVSYFQSSWTRHRLGGRLRSTHLVAITVKEVCAVMWRKDRLLTVTLMLALSRWKASHWLSQGEKGDFHLYWASYLFDCCFSTDLRRELFCSFHFSTGAKNL